MAGRNHIPYSGSKLRPNDGSVSLRSGRRLTPAEVHIIEDRIAAQNREIQTLLHDNQRLANTHVSLKQEVAAAQQDLRRLSAAAPSIKVETDAQVREVHERSLKLEAEARSVDGLSAELDRLRAEIKELRDERKELSEKLKEIEGDISSTQPELQEYSDLKTEIEAWQREIRRGRAAIEYERKMLSNNSEISEAMEQHMISVAREADKLRTELANAEQRATTAVVGAAPANQGPGYAIQQPGYALKQSGNAIQQPGYGGHSLSDPHVVQPGYAILQPGYAIPQPGYVGNSLSAPHAVHPGYGGNSLPDPHAVQPGYAIQQPGYGITSLPDPLAVQPGYAIQQPGYGINLLSDPHAVQPGHAIQQPGYGGNSLSDSHAVQPGCGGNTLSDPHADHQGEDSNKKAKVESEHSDKKGKVESKQSSKKRKAETNLGGKRLKCAVCQKVHRGECLKGQQVCFKCKEPGHNFYECSVLNEKEPEEKGKEEADHHVTTGMSKAKTKTKMGGKKQKCADCKKKHYGECLKGRLVCFKCKEPGHKFHECPTLNEKEPKEEGKVE